MREIGGYIELDTYRGKMLYDDGIKLNCGRNALAYLIQARKIKNILMPKFMCNSCNKVLYDNHVSIRYYSIDLDFKPIIPKRYKNEWLYLVNFYGQLQNSDIQSFGANLIVDNAHAYFQEPISSIDTIYTCRKFFGVTDGAILYSNSRMIVNEQDESFERMHFILGRFERSASEYFDEYVYNNRLFMNESIKRMSKLTENLLHGIDYNYVKKVRVRNFSYLHTRLNNINKLHLTIPIGPFMYPLYIDEGTSIRLKLLEKKIYIPTLWPAVFDLCNEMELEYDMAKNILPLPVDQRYDLQDMEYLINEIFKCM